MNLLLSLLVPYPGILPKKTKIGYKAYGLRVFRVKFKIGPTIPQKNNIDKSNHRRYKIYLELFGNQYYQIGSGAHLNGG